MIFTSELIPASWHWFFSLLMVLSLFAALVKFPFLSVRSVPFRQHLILGSSIFLFALWWVRIPLEDGTLQLHIIGMTSIVMMLGWAPAMFSATIAIILSTFMGKHAWIDLPMAFFFAVLIPVAVTQIALRIVTMIPMNNMFIYMLGGGFLGGICVRLTLGLVFVLITSLAGDQMMLHDTGELYLPYILILAFPEGVVNGMLVTMTTVWFPHWMRSFNEKRYIDNGF